MRSMRLKLVWAVVTLCGGAGVAVFAAATGTAASATLARPHAGAEHKESAAAPVLPHLSVQQLIEKNVAARGGAGSWQAVKSISYSGSMDAGKIHPDNGLHASATEKLIQKPGKSSKLAQSPEQKTAAADSGTPIKLPYTIIMKRPDKQRVEIKFKDETLVQVYDGTNGWKLQPYLNRGGALPFSAEELKKAKQFQQIDGPLVDYSAKGTKISSDGTDMVDGRPAYRLKLVLKSGDTRRVWLDAATFLDVQVDGSRRFNGREVTTYTTLRDFRAVGAVKVPYELETRTPGMPEPEKIVIEKVVLNPQVDDSQFAKPT